MEQIYDLIIIGSGPAGLGAAIYAKRAELKTLVIEREMMSGGQVLTTYEVDNYAGLPGIGGFDLGMKFREHADKLGVEFAKDTVLKIETADLADENEVLEAAEAGAGHPPVIRQVVGKKETRLAKAVIIASGAHHRKLGIPGEAELTGKGVSYCATCDAEFFKGKEIYVLGAGDQAIEESDYLTGFASKVTIVVLHEEGHLDCNEVAAEHAYKNPKIDFVWSSTVQEIKGSDHVESLVLKNVDTGRETEVKADGLFLFVGMVPQTGLVKDMVDCDKAGYIKVNEKMETNVPGLYAAGDCTQTFLRQVVTSAADGAVAAVASERYVKELEQIQGILGPDSGRTVFLFYNPYSNEEIEKTAQLEQELSGQWRVYRQDVTRQSLLYNSLKLERTVAGAFYDNGKLVEIKQAF